MVGATLHYVLECDVARLTRGGGGQGCRLPPRPSPSGGERRYLRPQIPFSRTRTLVDFCAGSFEVYCGICCSTTQKLRSQTAVPPACDPGVFSATFASAGPPAHRRSSGRRHSCRKRSSDRRCIRGCRSEPRLPVAARPRTSRTTAAFQGSCGRANPSLGPPESAAGPVVGCFAGRIDASGVVSVALSSTLRHPRGPLRISEAFGGADVPRAPLIFDLCHDDLRRLTHLRLLQSVLFGAQLRHSAAILALWAAEARVKQPAVTFGPAGRCG
jgi:hypothetical protein